MSTSEARAEAGIMINNSNRSESEDSQADISYSDDDSSTVSHAMTQERPYNLLNRDEHNYSRSRARAHRIPDQRCRNFILAANAIGEIGEVREATAIASQELREPAASPEGSSITAVTRAGTQPTTRGKAKNHEGCQLLLYFASNLAAIAETALWTGPGAPFEHRRLEDYPELGSPELLERDTAYAMEGNMVPSSPKKPRIGNNEQFALSAVPPPPPPA